MSSSTPLPPPGGTLPPPTTTTTSSGATMPTTTYLTPLEQEVLDEYARLLNNMNILATSIQTLSSAPTTHILDSLRELEKKMGLVFTSLKASVYSIVLQQQLDEEEDMEGRGGGGGGGGGEGYGGGGADSAGEGSDGSY